MFRLAMSSPNRPASHVRRGFCWGLLALQLLVGSGLSVPYDDGQDDLVLIPSRARVVISLRPSAEAGPKGLPQFQRELLDLLDLSSDYDGLFRFVGLEVGRVERLTLARGTAEDEWMLALVHLRGETGLQEGEVGPWRIAQVEDGLWAVGDPEAVQQSLDLSQGRSSQRFPLRLKDLLDADSKGLGLWVLMTADWLGVSEIDAGAPGWSLEGLLAKVEGAGLAVWGADPIRLRSSTYAGSGSDALFLADALDDNLPRDRSGALAAAASAAKVEAVGKIVHFELELSSEAVEGLGESETAKGLLRWRFNSRNRERWQRVADIFKALGLEKGHKVADIGSGGGFLTVRLARAVGEAGRVWAVEVSESQVRRLEERARKSGLTQVEAVKGDSDDPRLPEGELDAVVVINAYHEMEHYESMLGHMFASLKPGGRLAFVEPWNPSKRDAPRAEQVKDHDIAPELAEEELREAGFEILRREDDFITEHNREWLIVARRPTR